MQDSRLSRASSLAIPMALALGFALSLVAAPAPAEEGLPASFSAIAVNMGVRGPRGQIRIDMTVNRWSSDEERAVLIEAAKASGSRSLADALRQQERVGRIREIQGLGWDLQYSRVFPTPDGGQQIVLATDRPLDFAEMARATRSRDYNVTLIVLTLDAEGSGEGQLMLGAEFSWNEEKNQLTIEHFSSEPVRLTSVSRR